MIDSVSLPVTDWFPSTAPQSSVLCGSAACLDVSAAERQKDQAWSCADGEHIGVDEKAQQYV